MIRFIRKYPLFLSALLCVGAVVFNYYFEGLSLTLALLLVFAYFYLLYERADRVVRLCALCVAVVCVLSVFVLKDIRKTDSFSGKTAFGEAVICNEPIVAGEDIYRVTIKVKRSPLLDKNEKITALFYGEQPDFRTGDIISFRGNLCSLKEQFDALAYYSDKIYLCAQIEEYSILSKSPIYSFIGQLNSKIKGLFFSNLPREQAATLFAVTVGDRQAMTDYFYGCVKGSGVAHVMVVSGMHLAIIMSVISGILARAFSNRYIKTLLTVLSVLLICAVCGFSDSVLRAGVTYVIGALSFLFRRQNTPANTLGAAVVILLMASPLMVFSIAFQLTVLSTFGVLVVAPALSRAIRKYIKSPTAMAVVDIMIISLCAMVMTSPVTIYHFGYISVVAILTNLLISFATTIMIVLCIIAVAVSFIIPIFSRPIVLLCGVVCEYVNSVILLLGSMPFATVELPRFLVPLCVAAIVLIVCFIGCCAYYSAVIKLKNDEKEVISGIKEELKCPWYMRKRSKNK